MVLKGYLQRISAVKAELQEQQETRRSVDSQGS